MPFHQQPRLAARLGFTLVVAFFLSICVVSWLTPSDNKFRSLLRFHWSRTQSVFQKPLNEQTWIFERPLFTPRWNNEVGIIIKTGYGTQDRVLAQFKAMQLEGTNMHTIVVGNFNATLEDEYEGIKVEVEDVVGNMLSQSNMAGLREKPRALRYQVLRDAIDRGDKEEAKEIAKNSGWDIDALKFIPALELAYKRAPHRKWWIVTDDDTYLVKHSLERVLGHLNPDEPHYVGNAIGDYQGRFAHGGSAVLISGRTLQDLFERPEIVQDAKERSLDETWGDKLVATTLMKLGIYLNEQYTPFFNGEPPRITKINADNFCLPIASFHGLADASRMQTVGKILHDHDNGKMIFRGAMWVYYGEPDIMSFAHNPIHRNHDHVGKPSEATTTIEGVESALDCVGHCDKPWSSCLAWTWDSNSKECLLAPYTIIGEEAQGKHSGLHYPRAMDIGKRCEEMMRKMHWSQS